MENFKKVLFSGGIGVIIASYFLLIFMKVWLPGRESRLFKWTTKVYGGYPIASIFDMNWILIALLLVGIGLFIFFWKDKSHLLPWFGLYILSITYTNYIGFDKAFQTRFNLPLYLAVFLGMGLYLGLKLIKVKLSQMIAITISVILCLGFILLIYSPTNSQGMMNPYYWEGLQWIKDNTPEKSDVFYFYHGYLSSRNAFENGERVTNTIDLEDYAEAMQEKEIRRDYKKITGRGKMYFKVSAWDWVDRNQLNNSEFEGLTDICNYEYYSFEVYDQNNQMSPFVQYNLVLRQTLLNHEQIKEVFNNQVISILKNDKPGEECVG